MSILSVHKNRKRAAAAAVCAALAAAVFCGCSRSASSASGGEAPALDSLTGQQAQYEGQRAAAVVIANASDTTVQWGVSSASVVIEALTESDRPTELCLVYPALSAMPKVGPVSEGRDIYWRLLSAQQVLPVQRGGDTYNENYFDYYNITPLDALVAGRRAFFCPSEGWNNSPPWYTSGSSLASVLGDLNVSAELSPSGKTVKAEIDPKTGEAKLTTPPLLSFGEDEPPEPDTEDAQSIRLSFDEANATSFVYDAESSSYLMQRADGSALIDANNRKQAAFDNLLVLYTAPTLRDDGRTLDYDLSVGGGVWLRGGRLWNITWSQGSESTLTFYDSDGRKLDITPGRSYIALVASFTGDEVTVADSNGQAVAGGY